MHKLSNTSFLSINYPQLLLIVSHLSLNLLIILIYLIKAQIHLIFLEIFRCSSLIFMSLGVISNSSFLWYNLSLTLIRQLLPILKMTLLSQRLILALCFILKSPGAKIGARVLIFVQSALYVRDSVQEKYT